MINFRKSLAVCIILAIALNFITACSLDETDKKKTLLQQYYSLDIELPPPLITDFSPLDTRPESIPFEKQKKVNWYQSDYFAILENLFQFQLKDTLGNWQLNKMSFSLNCTDVNVGLQNGRFEFVKYIHLEEQEIRISRYIDIDPRNKFIYILETESSSKGRNRVSISLETMIISAEDALQIAENEGGQIERQNVQNICDIDINYLLKSTDLLESFSKDFWQVGYSESGKAGYFYKGMVDPSMSQ